MSSAESEARPHASSGEPPKKRRFQTPRACDRCRVKKTRCDGSPQLDKKCTQCNNSKSICHFTDGPLPPSMVQSPVKAYVQNLENRLERMEALLSQLHPNDDFSDKSDGDDSDPPPEPKPPGNASLPSMPTILDNDSDSHTSEDEDELSDSGHIDFTKQFQSLNVKFSFGRFFGRSSGMLLFEKALNLKSEVSGEQAIEKLPLYRRPDYWQIQPWECSRVSQRPQTSYTFPPLDLMSSLIDFYFRYCNPLHPLLHRPTFDQQIAEGLYLTDDGIGAVVSLVCALGSRFSDDPRVLLDDPEKPNHPHSAGWVWFNQVELVRNVALVDPTLPDLQVCALGTLYVLGSATPQTCWSLSGIGLRMAQDVGAHRRQTYLDQSPIEAELWRRAFWVLFCLDVWMSSFLGRSCAIPLHSINNPFPADCDDEYWTNVDHHLNFQQPPDKPSTVSFFMYWIKLYLILSHALRTIYSPDKEKIIAQIGEQEWGCRTVSVLDSELNKWLDSLPDHLRWDPTREDETRFMQAACLHVAYYMVLMTVHRPFIPSLSKGSSLSFPSLAICVHSARACSHILEAQRHRLPGMVSPQLLLPAAKSGIILLLGIWGAKRSGLNLNAAKEMEDVHSCMRFIGTGEGRWAAPGRLRDLLRDLTTAGDLPLPGSPTSATGKRARDDNNGGHDISSSTSDRLPYIQPPAQRKIAGQQHVSQETSELSTLGPPLSAEDQQHLEADVAAATAAPSSVNTVLPNPSAFQPLGGPSSLDRAEHSSIPSASASMLNMFENPTPTTYGASLYDEYLAGLAPIHTRGAHVPVVGPAYTGGTGVYGQASFYDGQVQQLSTTGRDGGSIDSGTNVAGMETDELMNCFASMAPEDGQMVVDNDMMAMWSTLPDGFQAEDWDMYVSNFVGITNPSATEWTGPQGVQFPPAQASDGYVHGQTSFPTQF